MSNTDPYYNPCYHSARFPELISDEDYFSMTRQRAKKSGIPAKSSALLAVCRVVVISGAEASSDPVHA